MNLSTSWNLSSISSIYVFIIILGFVECQTLNKNITKGVAVSIAPADFKHILTSKVPFHYAGVDGKIGRDEFLTTFNKFLLTFDFKIESDEPYLQLKTICKAAAEYNLEQSVKNDTAGLIKLWISIIPHGNIINQVDLAAGVIKEANTIYNETVFVFIINYRLLRLSPQTLPLINRDILSTKEIIGNIFTGVILDISNCFGSSDQFRQVVLHSVDLFIFLPYAGTIGNTNTLLGVAAVSCVVRFLKVFTRPYPTLGLKVPVPIIINPEKHQFFIDPKLPNMVVLNTKASITIVQAYTTNTSNDVSVDPVMVTKEAQEKWLQQELQINRKFLGLSAFDYNKHEPLGRQELLSNMYKDFCKIILQQRRQPPDNFSNLFHLMNLTINYKQNLVKDEYLSRDCDNSMNEILLAVNTFGDEDSPNFWDINKRVISNATNTAKEIDNMYPDIQTTLLFNFDTCYHRESCLNLSTADGGLFLRYSYMNSYGPFFDEVHRNIKEIQFNKEPKYGIILNWQFCWLNDKAIYFYKPFMKVDTFIFKLYIHVDTITGKGALHSITQIMPLLHHCSSILQLLEVNPQSKQLFNRTEVFFNYAYYVVLYGCGSRSFALNESMEIARFYDLINQWATSVETIIYIGTAAEYEVNSDPEKKRKCGASYAYTADENCDCGWWTVLSRKDGNHKTGYATLENKKLLALKLFQQTYLTPVRQTSTTPIISRDLLMKVVIPIAIITGIFVSIFIAMSIRYRRQMRQHHYVEAVKFLKGCHSKQNQNIYKGSEVDKACHNKPYNIERFELLPCSFKIDNSKSLGSGKFSTVFLGTVLRNDSVTNVAVKGTKKLEGGQQKHADLLALKGLISEIKILSYVGDHLNVVGLVGAFTADLKRGKIFVFLELCEFGSLFKYLRSFDTSSRGVSLEVLWEAVELLSEKRIPSVVNDELCRDLLRWSQEIACGMEFVASKKIVHADLATRNVLLTANKCAKISDFGLARRLYDYSEYLKQEAGPLPWRWMAPESLRKLVFDEKTDVWAFGVTLWEIYSLADEPYSGLSWEINFPRMLERGLRLEQPLFSTLSVYNVMKMCWHISAIERPTFSELGNLLRDMSNKAMYCEV